MKKLIERIEESQKETVIGTIFERPAQDLRDAINKMRETMVVGNASKWKRPELQAVLKKVMSDLHECDKALAELL